MKTTNQRLIAAATLFTCITNLQFAQAQDYLDMPTAKPAVKSKVARSTNQVEGQSAQKQVAKKEVVIEEDRTTPSLYMVPRNGGKIGLEISYLKLNDTIKASSSGTGTAKNGEITSEVDIITTKAIYSLNKTFALGIGAGYLQSKSINETVNTSLFSTSNAVKEQTSVKGATDPIFTGKMTFDSSALTFSFSLDAQLPMGKAESTQTASSQTSNLRNIERSSFTGGGTVGGSLLAYTNNNTSALLGARLSYLNKMERSEVQREKYDSGLTQNTNVKTTGGSVMEINTFAESVSSSFIRFGGALGYAKQDDEKQERGSAKFQTVIAGPETALLTAYMNLSPAKGFELVPSVSYIELLNKGRVADSIFQSTGIRGGNADSVTRWQAGILGRISF